MEYSLKKPSYATLKTEGHNKKSDNRLGSFVDIHTIVETTNPRHNTITTARNSSIHNILGELHITENSPYDGKISNFLYTNHKLSTVKRLPPIGSKPLSSIKPREDTSRMEDSREHGKEHQKSVQQFQTFTPSKKKFKKEIKEEKLSAHKKYGDKEKNYTPSKLSRPVRYKSELTLYADGMRNSLAISRGNDNFTTSTSRRSSYRPSRKFYEASSSVNRLKNEIKRDEKNIKNCEQKADKLENELDKVKKTMNELEARIESEKKLFSKAGDKMKEVKDELNRACKWIEKMKSQPRVKRKSYSKRARESWTTNGKTGRGKYGYEYSIRKSNFRHSEYKAPFNSRNKREEGYKLNDQNKEKDEGDVRAPFNSKSRAGAGIEKENRILDFEKKTPENGEIAKKIVYVDQETHSNFGSDEPPTTPVYHHLPEKEDFTYEYKINKTIHPNSVIY